MTKEANACVSSASAFSMEMTVSRAGKSVFRLLGAEKIECYSEEKMSFRCGKSIVSVEGKKLICRTYGNRFAEVEGCVGKICL